MYLTICEAHAKERSSTVLPCVHRLDTATWHVFTAYDRDIRAHESLARDCAREDHPAATSSLALVSAFLCGAAVAVGVAYSVQRK